MDRRDFLAGSRRAVIGACLLPSVVARTEPDREPIGMQGGAPRVTLIADLERIIPRLMEDAVVPGLSIAVVQQGRLLWRRGFGVKDRASNDPVDDHTVFEAASVSKTAFAYAVMKLVEKGVVNLDTPLTTYASKRFLEGDPRLELITARHVLSHTSGFQDWRSGEAPLKIHFAPGARFLYSGEGYSYLQSVVTHLTGHTNPKACATYEAGLEVCATDIDAYMKRSLLGPFGMDSSGYVWGDGFARHAARPHDSHGAPLTKAKPTAADAARYGSAGGLHTTAADYARFLVEVVNPKSSDAFRLSRPSLNEMLRPQVKLDEQQKIDGASSWALGWAIQERAAGNVLVHSGGQAGFRSLAMASVERKSGFIVLTNGDNGMKVIADPGLASILNRLLPA